MDDKDKSSTQNVYHSLFALMALPLSKEQLIFEIVDEIDEAIENGISMEFGYHHEKWVNL